LAAQRGPNEAPISLPGRQIGRCLRTSDTAVPWRLKRSVIGGGAARRGAARRGVLAAWQHAPWRQM
jgi:hypothetical protein